MLHTNHNTNVLIDSRFNESYEIVRAVYDNLALLTSLSQISSNNGNNNTIDISFTPSNQVSTTNFGATYLREFVEHKLYLNMLNPTLDGTVNIGTRLQMLVNQAASANRIGSREVVISGKGTSRLGRITSTINLPVCDGLKIICDDETTLLSGGTTPAVGGLPAGMAMFNMQGTHPDSVSPTNWIALTANAYKNADRIVVANSSSFLPGDLIALRNDYVIDTSPNIYSIKQEQPLLITRIEGNTLILTDPLVYDFLIANTHNSRVQKYGDVRKNTVFENIRVGKFGIDTYQGTPLKHGRGIQSRFSTYLQIKNCVFENSRFHPYTDATGMPAVSLTGDYKPTITDLVTKYTRGYGIEINGSCFETVVNRHDDYYSRHPISLNWSANANFYDVNNLPYSNTGEPIRTKVFNLTSSFSTKSGFDTHDVGIDTYVENLKVIGAGNMSNFNPNLPAGLISGPRVSRVGGDFVDFVGNFAPLLANVGSGVQLRTGDVHFHNIYIEGCSDFGIRTNSPTELTPNRLYSSVRVPMPIDRQSRYQKVKITGKCELIKNGRGGINIEGPIEVDEVYCKDCGYAVYYADQYQVNPALVLYDAHIKKATIINSGRMAIQLGNDERFSRPMKKILIENLYAPASENQTELMVMTNKAGDNYSYANVEIRNTIDISGYDSYKIFQTRDSVKTDLANVKMTNSGIGKDNLSGEFRLVNGKAFVLNDNIIDPNLEFENKIFLEPRPIFFSNYFPSSRFNRAEVGAVNDPLTNFPLPQFWARGGKAFNTLNLSVVNISPLNIEFPYIDLRINGTTGTNTQTLNGVTTTFPRTNYIIYFGVINNKFKPYELDSRPFTSYNDNWKFMTNLDLMAGSLSDIIINPYLTIYPSEFFINSETNAQEIDYTPVANDEYNNQIAESEANPVNLKIPKTLFSDNLDTVFNVTSTDTAFNSEFTITQEESYETRIADKIRTGLYFNFPVETAVDFTIRLSKLALHKLNETLYTVNGNLRIVNKIHNVGFNVNSYTDADEIDTTDNRKINYRLL